MSDDTDAERIPATEFVGQFRNQLPSHVRNQLHDTIHVAVLLNRAINEQGWTVEQLVAECSRNMDGVKNAGGLATYRLERAAAAPRPERELALRKVHNGCCESGLIYDETVDPPSVTKCPGALRGDS